MSKGKGNLPSPRETLKELQNHSVAFSFKYLDIKSNEKFSPSGWFNRGEWNLETSCKYIETLFERLKDVSSWNVDEFRGDKSKALRSHPISWPETSEPNGFIHLNSQLQDEEPWQFQLSANEYGRVHGFMIDNFFYVVWLDPFHLLYPSK